MTPLDSSSVVIGFPDGFPLRGYKQKSPGVDDTRCLLINMLRKASRSAHFDSPHLRDHLPSSYERPQNSFVPLTTTFVTLLQQLCCSRRHYVAVTHRSSPCGIIVLWKTSNQAGVGRLSTVPCVRFYLAGGAGGSGFLPSPVIGLTLLGGRLFSVPIVRFHIAGEDGIRPFPLLDLYPMGGTIFFHPL